MNNSCQNNSPTVFISYAHEEGFSKRVAELSDWLRDKGVQVITDHPYKNRAPEQGWRAWMQHNIEDCDLVLIVCSERYKALFEKRNVTGQKRYGVTWESAIVTSELYESRMHESIAESPGGIAILRELSHMPGIRVLASSRVPLDNVLGHSLFVGPLNTDSSDVLTVGQFCKLDEDEKKLREFLKSISI